MLFDFLSKKGCLFSFLLFARAVPKLLTHHTLTLPSGRGNSMAFRSDTGIQTDGLSWLKGGTGVARCVS